MNWLKRFVRGYPMKFKCQAFRDAISGSMVNVYTDTLGREWLANSRFSLFRVRRV